MVFPHGDFNVHLFGNFKRVVYRVYVVGEQLRHLLAGFNVKLVVRVAHAVFVGKQCARIYAKHCVVRFGVFFVYIVAVVCGNQL